MLLETRMLYALENGISTEQKVGFVKPSLSPSTLITTRNLPTASTALAVTTTITSSTEDNIEIIDQDLDLNLQTTNSTEDLLCKNMSENNCDYHVNFIDQMEIQRILEQQSQQLCNKFLAENGHQSCACDSFTLHLVDSNQSTTNTLCDIIMTNETVTDVSIIANDNDTPTNFIALGGCQLLNQSLDNCSCESLLMISHEGVAFDTCLRVIDTTTTNTNLLETMCNIFGISKEECTCEEFHFAQLQRNYDSVCHLVDVVTDEIPMIEFNYLEEYFHTYATIAVVASVIGIAGNLLIALVAIKLGAGLSTCKKLIGLLAGYDLVFAVFQLIESIPRFWTRRFIYGKTVCKIIKSSESLGSYLAIGIILIISIERFIGIVNPFHGGLSKRKIQAMLLINLIFGISAIIPMLLFYDSENSMQACVPTYPQKATDSKIYNLVVLAFYYVIPLCVITVLYTLIIKTLSGTVAIGNSTFIADPRLRKKRMRDNKRTMYVLASVVVSFVILVFPRQIVYIYFDFTNETDITHLDTSEFFSLMYIAYLTYPFHVTINPIIYSIIDARWRTDLRNFCTGRSRLEGTTVRTTLTSTTTTRRKSSIPTILENTSTLKAKRNPNIPLYVSSMSSMLIRKNQWWL